jgi:phage host-nuclease inhibitor protein Gam
MADEIETQISNAVKPLKAVRARGQRAAARLRTAAVDAATDVEDELEEQVASLSDQLARLAQQVEQFAEERYGDARELVASVGDAGAALASRARRQTRVAARAVREDPLPTVVAVGVLALLAAIIIGRMNDR